MRRFFHVLLITLLLLRGGMDAAMANPMAFGMHALVPATSHHAMMTDVAMADAEAVFMPGHHATAMTDCAGHPAATQNHDVGATTTADTVTANTFTHSPADTSHADCDSCSACQSCHSVALSSNTAAPEHALTVSAIPNSAQSQFASADSARGHKPPIS